MDIKLKTCLVIRKNGQYLVGKILWSQDLRWSQYVYDAYRTRNRERAAELARRTGGIMVLFNSVTGETRTIGA